MIKRYLAEFLGTMVIVFAPVAYAAVAKVSGREPNLFEAAMVSGLPVLAMIYALGALSAAHFNPAVTLGFALAKKFPWKYVPGYWGAQFLGGLSAATLSFVLFGVGAGAHIPSDPLATIRNLGIEACLSFMLMLVIIAVATDRRVSSGVPGLAIGLTVVFAILIGGPITGASMNPARSFGPALFVPAALNTYWIYLIGPSIGTVLAVIIYEAIRLEPQFAKGAPAELLVGEVVCTDLPLVG